MNDRRVRRQLACRFCLALDEQPSDSHRTISKSLKRLHSSQLLCNHLDSQSHPIQEALNFIKYKGVHEFDEKGLVLYDLDLH